MITSLLGFLAITIGIGAATALIVFGLVQGVRFIRTSNASLKAVTRSNESMVCDLWQTAARCSDSALSTRIQEIAELLRFSDSAIAVPTDESLRQKIAELSETVHAGDATGAAEALGAIERLAEERNAVVALERRGSF